jgi:DNA-binding MurR/RpiR family transcriptional regulator
VRAVDEGDVVCIIGFRPYSRESVVVAEHAARRGATLIAITDSPLAPFAREAKIVLTFSTEGPSLFPSLVSAWAIVEHLLDTLVARGGEAVLDRLKSAEAQLQALGVFVPAYGPSDN